MKWTWEKSGIRWTSEKPRKAGNYWYRRVANSLAKINSKPQILYVNSDLCVPQLNLLEYREPISVNEYKGQWAGPIPEPEDYADEDLAASLTESS